MDLQVLVATVGQSEPLLPERMNIKCSAVIANQADREEIVSRYVGGYEQKIITTKSRGVGLNRNIALLASTADILLFSDDDVKYYNDMPQRVLAAFAENPRADVIIFGMNMTVGGKIVETRKDSKKRLYVWNSMRYGTYRIAVRREAVVNNNITFNQLFGGGCPFSAGEDSLFLKTCFDFGLGVYSSDYVLGECSKDQSTWFCGYNEKYFYDKGVLLKKLFPKTAWLMALYFGIRFKRETELRANQRLRLIYSGIKGGRRLMPYIGTVNNNEKDSHC